MERRASARYVPTIAPDGEFACPRRLSLPCMARFTRLRGTPINTLDASAMTDTVVRIVLRRSARPGKIS